MSVRRWRYAADGKVIQTQESDGTVRSVLYDDNGRISQIIHPGGAIEAYLYDADGRTAWHRAATGVETEYEYDDAGRVHRQTVGGLVTEQTYDGYGRLETVTDPRGPQTRFEYDAQDRIVRTRIGQERVEALTYDARGAVLSTTIYDVSELATSDALQTRSAPSLDAILADVLANQPHRVRTASTVYDAQGRPIERTDALGTVTTLTYDDAGRKLTETDARGVVTTYGYDAETGLLERIARDDQDGRVLVTTMRHDRGGRVVAQTGPDGATTRTVYDALGRVTATIDPLGNRSTRSYDRFGRVVSQTNAVGDTTAMRYDAAGRVVAEIGVDVEVDGDLVAPTARKAYDAAGRVIASFDPDGNETNFLYDDRGRLVRTIGPLVRTGTSTPYRMVSEREYDPATGDLIAETTGLVLLADAAITAEPDRSNARTVRTIYDIHGRRRFVVGTDPDGDGTLDPPITETAYNGFGEVVATVASTGLRTDFVRDAAGRVVSQTVADPDGSGPGVAATTASTYNAAGDRLTQTDALGHVTRFTYDGFGRLIQTTLPAVRVLTESGPRAVSPTTSRTYDAVGRVTFEIDAAGAVTAFEYDDAGRLIQTTLPDPDGPDGPLKSAILTRTYAAAGRVIEETDEQGRTIRTEYGPGGRAVRTTIAAAGGSGATKGSTRGYDLLGRVVSETDPLGRTTTHAYDELGRRIATTLPDPDGGGQLPAPTRSMEYGAAGNLEIEVDVRGNRTTHEYDLAGRRLRTTQDGDASTEDDDIRRLWSYDSHGRVVSETSAVGHTVYFTYDRAGQRVQITDPAPATAASGGARTTRMRYDALGRLVETTDAFGNATETHYDALGRIAMTVGPEVVVQTESGPARLERPAASTLYDIAGRAVWQSDALGRVTRMTYDARGRLVRTIGPAPDLSQPTIRPVTETVYDDRGLVVAERSLWRNEDYRSASADWATTTLAYDGFARRVTTTTPDPAGWQTGVTTTLTYDAADRVTATEQSARAVGGGIETRTSTTEYDALDRIIRTVGVDPDGAGELRGATKEFGYDDDGDLDSERTLFAILAGDVEVWATTTHEHDAFGRVTRTIGPQGSDGVRPVFETAYNAAGQIVAATDPLGLRTLRLHDSRGQLLVATLPYDARLSGTGESLDTRPIPPNEHPSNPLNGALSVRSTYDRLGRVIQTTDSRDRITSTEYDALGRVVRTVGPDPDTGDSALTGAAYTETEYDLGGRAVAVVTGWIGGESRRITTEYDDLDRVIRTSGVHASDAALDGTTSAPTTRTTYDLAGNVLSRTPAAGATLDRHDPSQPGDPADAARTYTYNVLGQLLEEKLPRNAAGQHAYLRFAYDSWGNRIEEIDPLGHSTHRTFDALGRETHAVGPDPDGGLLSDGTPNVDGAGRGDYRRSDRNGEFGDEHASETYRFYGQHGGVVEIRTKRDAISRVAVNHPDGGPSDLLATYNRNVFVATVYEYDRLGRKIAEHSPPNADGLVATIGWEYDAAGQMTAHVDPLGNRIEFAYDHFGHVVADTDSYGHTRFWDYDAHGRLQRSSLRTGQEISYGYDALDRRTRETWRNAAGVLQRNITTEYNARGEVEANFAADGNGSPVGGRVESAYDRRGCVVTETQRQYGIAGMTGELATLEYAYDAADRLRRTKLTDWADNVSLTTYSFDALGQIIGQTHSGSSGSGVNAVTVTSEFDLAGRMTRLTRIGQERAVLTDYEYDAAGRLDRLIHWYSSVNSVTDPNTPVLPGPGGGRSLAETYFQQDAAGLVVGRLEHSSNQPAYFRHDATGQLIFSDYVGTGADEKYWCDLAGNRTHAVLSVDGSRRNYSPNSTLGTPYRYQDTPSGAAGNRLTRDPNYEYTYDAEGRLATRTARFGTEAGHKSTYTWNADGSLRRVITKDEGGAVLADARYHYDPHDRLVAKTVSRPGHPEATERYVVHGGTDSAQIVAMADAAGTVVDRTLLSGETDRPIAVDPVAAGYDGRVRWQLADHLGSVRLSMADVPLADVKAASPFVEYAAFGGLLDATGIAYTDLAGTRYGYTGQRWDADAGLGGCITTAPADTTRLSDLKGRPLRLDRPGRTVRRRCEPVPLRRQPADEHHRSVRQVPQEAVRGHRQGVQPPDRQAVQ